MELGMVGLGRMGANMTRRLRRGDLEVYVFDQDPEPGQLLARDEGAHPTTTLAALIEALEPPRMVWLMLPAGAVTETTIEQLARLLAPGDCLVDGANSHYKDSLRRAANLRAIGIDFIDAGVSGGVWGLEQGYGLMLGGTEHAVSALVPALSVLAPSSEQGWVHCGPAGSGHFVKMIHNGIEYGMMQAYAEGFSLLAGHPEFDLDVAAIAESWRHGSVVRSWLLDLTAPMLADKHALENTAPWVADSGAGRWTVQEAIDQGVPAPVISTALMTRFASQGRGDYTARLLALMRGAFGGHSVRSVREDY